MPISSTTRKTSPFVGDGISTTFTFTFKVFSDADLYVVKLNTSTDVETVLILTTNYSVAVNADQNVSPGGTVVLTTPLPVGYTLTITSRVANLQPTNLTNQGGFYPSVITDSLDRATIQIQQLQEQVDRAPKIPISSTLSTDTLAADVTTCADNAADINTVATDIASVRTVAAISTDVTTAATNVVDITNFADVYYGPSATDPTARKDTTALQYGDLYFNTATSKMRVYTSTGWDNTGDSLPVTITTQTFDGTGVQTDFTLSSAPAFLNALEVAILGVVQVPGTDYTLSGTTLTFTTAPPSATGNIFCRWYSPYSGGVPNDGSVTTAKLAPAIVVNGVTLASAATGFTVSGGTSSKTLTVPEDITLSKVGLQTLLGKYTSGLINIGLSATKSAKALTVALTTETGTTPSATDSAIIVFRDSTLTTGTPVLASVTSALSVTLPSGSHPGFSAGGAGRIYVWGIYYGSAVELAISRTADLFQEDGLVSTSAISGASSAAVMYSTSARTNVPCRLLGYIEITTGAVVGEWDNDPTKIQIMGPGVKRTGDIVQRSASALSGQVSKGACSALAYNNVASGYEAITLNFTPKSALNTIRARYSVSLYVGGYYASTQAGVWIGSDTNAIYFSPTGYNGPSAGSFSLSGLGSRVSGTTSAIDVKLRVGGSFGGGGGSNAFYLNYAGETGTVLEVEEIFA